MSTTGLMISLFDMASLPTMFPVVFRSENEWWNPHQTNPDIPITMVIHPFHHFRHWFETMVKSPFFWWKISKFLWWQKKRQILVNLFFMVKSSLFVVKKQILVNSFFMVKSHFLWWKKTNFAKFISHGKITFLCGEKTNLAKFISHGKITFLCGEKKQILLNSFLMVKSHFCGETKTNFAKFISHGKITFLCGEKNKSC